MVHYVSDVACVRHLRIVLLLLVHVVVLLKELLEALTRSDVVLLQTKDLEGLGLGHETPFDSQSFLGDLLTAFVGEFFTLSF